MPLLVFGMMNARTCYQVLVCMLYRDYLRTLSMTWESSWAGEPFLQCVPSITECRICVFASIQAPGDGDDRQGQEMHGCIRYRDDGIY